MKTSPSLSDPKSQRLIERHTPLVAKIARKLVRTLSSNVECDDLIQDGMMGLIDAILKNSRTSTSAEFESYVAQRARGAMLDGLRAIDAGSRQVRRNMRQVELILQRLGHELGRAPLEGEAAAAMGLMISDYQRILQDTHGYTLISMDDLGDEEILGGYLEQCAESSSDPLVVLERAELRRAIAGAIKKLAKQDRQLLSLYYEDGLKMHEVGKAMGLSESRISQLHAQAIAQLRASFTSDSDNAPPLLKPRRRRRQVGQN
jgi:RNA polymerase sigma factor for flagellar operon FliA